MNSVKEQLERQVGAQEWAKIIEDRVWINISEEIMMTTVVSIRNSAWAPIIEKTRDELSNQP